MDSIDVLIVDDSALMRNLVSRIVDSYQGLKAVDRAMNGRFALEKIPLCNPDIIVLDIEMPEMNGIDFLKERKNRNIDIPVIILSSLAEKNAKVTMECLELGACDFIKKPSGSISMDIRVVAESLAEKLLFYGQQYARKKGKTIQDFAAPVPKLEQTEENPVEKKQESFVQEITENRHIKVPVKPVVPLRESGKIEIIAIGISTGGPNALRHVFAKLDPDLQQPILVVQHMPAGFTEEFALSLNTICPLEVKEAHDGDIIKSGRVFIAPGNKHIYIEKKTMANVVRLSDEPQRNGHRPSADVLFESVAKVYQNRALGVIMTGMGNDGAVELAEMRRQGAHTLGQDEATSIVYGMPKVAYEKGGVERQVSLEDMADAINDLARRFQ